MWYSTTGDCLYQDNLTENKGVQHVKKDTDKPVSHQEMVSLYWRSSTRAVALSEHQQLTNQ